MTYTRIAAKQTVEHIESDTWRNERGEIRLHRYRCKACKEEFVFLQGMDYHRCPNCGFPIMVHRRFE